MPVRQMAHLAADSYRGRLPTYTSIGAYPLIYLTVASDVLCADCANTELVAWRADYEYWEDNAPIAGDVYWEGPVITCDECNKPIESAYGDPEENSDSPQLRGKT